MSASVPTRCSSPSPARTSRPSRTTRRTAGRSASAHPARTVRRTFPTSTRRASWSMSPRHCAGTGMARMSSTRCWDSISTGCSRKSGRPDDDGTSRMSKGTHDYTPDARNASIKVSLDGVLVPRDEAKVSVFDAGYVLGDGVWEGLRLHDGGLPFLDLHLDRLYEGAKAIDMGIGLTRAQLTERLLQVLRANKMHEHVHIRLMVTRGVKATPHQDPRFVIGPTTVVIVPEYKEPLPATVEQGIRLFTVHVRRGAPY